MDFLVGLPRTRTGHDAIRVIVDRLTKAAHFVSVNVKYSMEKLAELYIQEIVRLHRVPISVVSYRDSCLLQDFGEVYQRRWEPNYISALPIILKLMVSSRELFKY